jgi:hypothetical protein
LRKLRLLRELDVKNERIPKPRLLREMFSRDEDVEDEEDVLDSARGRTDAWACAAATEAAAASCSLDRRLSARRRRELSGLRRRGSLIMLTGNSASGPFLSVGIAEFIQ